MQVTIIFSVAGSFVVDRVVGFVHTNIVRTLVRAVFSLVRVNHELRKARGPKTNNQKHYDGNNLISFRLTVELLFEARLQVGFNKLFRELWLELFANKKEQLDSVSNYDAKEDAFEDSGNDVGRIMHH